MKSRLILSALILCASSTSFANPNPKPKNLDQGIPMPPEIQQRHIDKDYAMAMNQKHKFDVKGSVAQEYIDIGKLLELNQQLAKDVIDANIAMANKCGEVMPWKKLVDQESFRRYTSTTFREPVTADWLRENFSRLKDVSIDNPAYENVRLFFYAQRVVTENTVALPEDLAVEIQNPKEALDILSESLCRDMYPPKSKNFRMEN